LEKPEVKKPLDYITDFVNTVKNFRVPSKTGNL